MTSLFSAMLNVFFVLCFCYFFPLQSTINQLGIRRAKIDLAICLQLKSQKYGFRPVSWLWLSLAISLLMIAHLLIWWVWISDLRFCMHMRNVWLLYVLYFSGFKFYPSCSTETESLQRYFPWVDEQTSKSLASYLISYFSITTVEWISNWIWE